MAISAEDVSLDIVIPLVEGTMIGEGKYQFITDGMQLNQVDENMPVT